MGVGTTNVLERVAASIGELNQVSIKFSDGLDIPYGGVLFAVPALLSIGLLRYSEQYFSLPKGYYGVQSIFMLFAFMALGRVKTVESLRSHSPGEWGKLLGLDRIPEVKILREKIKLLSNTTNPSRWMDQLASDWMEDDPESAGILYIDGHVRVYHGKQTKLPRQYSARSKLCLRATMDYWVNAMDGRPFFKISCDINPGLIAALENDIVPKLEEMVPGQPTEIDLMSDFHLHRFIIIFDREGYSPDFFLRMKQKRIACITYHKYPDSDWPEEEFQLQKFKTGSGNTVKMRLAERGTRLSNGLWVREIRKLSQKKHQTSIISTNYQSDLLRISLAMFSRWSQENFFKYMRENYNLDSLIDYSLDDIDGTIRVVNPKYREIDGKVRSKTMRLNRKLTQFAAMSFKKDIDPKKMEAFQIKKSELQEEIEELNKEQENLKSMRKETKKHILISELPEEEQFKKLNTKSKYFIDTIKMIAYRAESAMANILSEKMSKPKEARSLLKTLYKTEVNILPDKKCDKLTVELHHLANKKDDKIIGYLCDELNSTKTIFPGTNLKIFYKLV